MSGWIKLYRGFASCEAFEEIKDPVPDAFAWVWLIENAAWKSIIRRSGIGASIPLTRGQIHVSDRQLASVWLWDKKRVRRFLDRLERHKMVVKNRDHLGTTLTICNYDEYQKNNDAEGPAKDQQRTTHKEGKEIKEERKETEYAFHGRVIRLGHSDFESWKGAYSAIPDLKAELQAQDDWLASQPEAQRKGWFFRTSGALKNKNHAYLAKARDIDKFDLPC